MQSSHASLKDLTITCLVRGEDRLKQLQDAYGSRVNPILYRDLDDTERTIEVASQHDIVINTTLGFHPESAASLVRGLAKRKEATGKDVWMIHTSGTSNLADQPLSGAYVHPEGKVFNDAKDDIYTYEKERNELFAYPQRTSELGVIDASIELGVKTVVIMSPTIYGRGTGAFNKSSIQVPAFISAALTQGQAVVVGEGKGEWDNVHVEDLAELYSLTLQDILTTNGNGLPTGKKGIIFSGARRHHWIDIASGVGRAAHKAGLVSTPEVKSLTLEEGAKVFPQGSELRVELSTCSFSRTESEVARTKLGWTPSRGEAEWEKGFGEEVEAVVANQKAG